jgi:hypothetical protein
MPRIAVINQQRVLAEMFAGPLVQAGHEVLTLGVPIDFEALLRFEPALIVIGLDRSQKAANRPIESPDDMVGYAAIAEMETYPAIAVVPILLVANAVTARDVSTRLPYDAFLAFPEDGPRYLPTVASLIGKPKTRRKISPYGCPHCGGRLTYIRRPLRDLFCPRCHTAVTLFDDKQCRMSIRSLGRCEPCTIAQLTPAEPSVEIEVLKPIERKRV